MHNWYIKEIKRTCHGSTIIFCFVLFFSNFVFIVNNDSLDFSLCAWQVTSAHLAMRARVVARSRLAVLLAHFSPCLDIRLVTAAQRVMQKHVMTHMLKKML